MKVVDLMKRFLSLIIILISLLYLGSCKKSETLDFEIITPEKIYMGDNSLSGFSLKLSDGSLIDLTEDMLEDSTDMSFFKEGSQTIKVKYERTIKETNINVVRRDFDVTYESKTVEYTGLSYKFEVSGTYPCDTTVYYEFGNEFTEVGSYTVTCVLSHPYYNTKTLEATLNIVEGGK